VPCGPFEFHCLSPAQFREFVRQFVDARPEVIGCSFCSRQRPATFLVNFWHRPCRQNSFLRATAVLSASAFMVLPWSGVLAAWPAPSHGMQAVLAREEDLFDTRTPGQPSHRHLLESSLGWEISVDWIMTRRQVVGRGLGPGHWPSIFICSCSGDRVRWLNPVVREVADVFSHVFDRWVFRLKIHESALRP